MNILDKQLIGSIAKSGHVMSVVDDEGVIQKRTDSVHAIVSAIDAVDECSVRVYKNSLKGSEMLGVLFFVDSELNDHSDNAAINALVTR
jgi:hypothetical protein